MRLRHEAAVPRVGWAARVRAAGAPLGVRPYRLYFTARLLSWAGSAVAPIGLAFAVLGLGGGSRGLGLVLAAGIGPQLVLLLVGGVVADRWSRARVMVWANVVCAVAEGLAAVLLWSGAAAVWHLVAMAGMCGSAMAFFAPAAGGIVAEAIPGPLRHSANALVKIGQNTVKVGGPVVGGALVATVGPGWVIAWDALTFALAAVLCARIELGEGRVKVRAGFVADLRSGWRDFWSRPWLWVMVLQSAVITPAWLVGYQMLGPIFGLRELGGAGPWGVVVAGFSAGLVAGGLVALAWRPRWVGRAVCGCLGSTSLPLAAMAAGSPLPILTAATALAGSGLAVSMTSWASLVQELVPTDRLSRTMSYSTLGQILPVPLAYLAAGPVSEAIGLRTTLAFTAVLVVAAAVAPLTAPEIRRLALAPVQEASTGLASGRARSYSSRA